MLGVTEWGRQLRFLLGLPVRQTYTAEQVLRYLRGDSSVGNLALQQIVERLPTLLNDSQVRRRYDGFQRYLEVLPRIIFQYHRGVPAAQIAATLSFLATEVGVETVVWITAQVIADRLNRGSS